MTKPDLSKFDYRIVAKYDSDMWRAYYNHQFFKLFWQLLQLMKSQLGLGWWQTLRLAYYAGWAAADYRLRKKQGIKKNRVLKNLEKFYRIVSTHSLVAFDYRKAAELELNWWEVHRRSQKNHPELEQSLAQAAAVIYGVDPKHLKTYAACRAEAMILPRHEGDNQAIPTDWQRVTELLEKSWAALYKVVNK